MEKPRPQGALAESRQSPVVRLLVCVGPRCNAEGRGRALLAQLREALDASFPPEDAACVSFTTRDCLRLCTKDPVVRIEPTGDAFSNPSVDDLLRAVAEAMAASPRAASTSNEGAPA